jgi:SAM-dependent methyltransferase
MSKWPKTLPPLTAEQQAIADDFVHYWHEVLPRRYSIVDRFGHQYVARTAPANFARTLEIGAGIGEHLEFERLSAEQIGNYYGLDLRANMLDTLRQRYPGVHAILGDCQQRQPFPNGYFDRIIAIHVLEHLPNLPAAVRELWRLCAPNRGVLQVVIPCEGSLAYTLARKISAQRIFEQRYKQPYDWFISREHINLPDEILGELSAHFSISRGTYFPIPMPIRACNLCIAFTASPIKERTDVAEPALTNRKAPE